MELNAPVILKEALGVKRIQEPVTVGIPLPRGVLTASERLSLMGPDQIAVPLQTTPLAQWDDGSVKWILLDFQISLKSGEEKKLLLRTTAGEVSQPKSTVSISDGHNEVAVDTGSAVFHVPSDIFKPFSQVLIDGQDFLVDKSSAMVLIDSNDHEGVPVISNWEWEIRGPFRSTLKMNGDFLNSEQKEQLSFVARLSFFAGLSICKVDFTLWNPRAAAHPGGLWDLGDPGSFYFKDLALALYPKFSGSESKISWQESANAVPESIENSNLQIYQDSSGGENWQSRNHVNRNNEVKTSFRGYRVVSAQKEIKNGLRAQPVIAVADGKKNISVGIRYFWQNFPKALEADHESITIRFFPHQFDDVFEMQGGERKTHTCLLNFQECGQELDISGWVHSPLEARSTPEWYAESQAVPYLTPETQESGRRLRALIQPAIKGENTFFDRREIIDEYGWRNFGDWYADHEAVGYAGKAPLVSHYNNQYDGVYGALCQYLRSGNMRWFNLADQLCYHARDIDIYHTDRDKPEYNRGLFWHTEHYLDAQTATHRCFSKRHAGSRDLSCYGGGPAMSHNYAWGFLYHYYLTGEPDSRDAVLALAQFVQGQVESNTTLTHFSVEVLRKVRAAVKNFIKGHTIVDFDKVFSLNGPGRGAGNSLSTLLVAYELTKDVTYLNVAENILRICIHPCDNLKKMDMLDVENRWMYTVFLQALGKYLDITEGDPNAHLWEYARDSLLLYARWMEKNEYLYLDRPEKLEYPNETWAAQEIRKSNVFFIAARYCNEPKEQLAFTKKAEFFMQGCLKQLQTNVTHELTRPITLLLQNSLVPSCFLDTGRHPSLAAIKQKKTKYSNWRLLGNYRLIRQFYHIVRTLSIKNEVEFIRWRVK